MPRAPRRRSADRARMRRG